MTKGTATILSRPDGDDKGDEERFYQTALEQTMFNKEFREIAKFLGKIDYSHPVPQMLKYPQAFSGPDLPGDPFGRGFLENLSHASQKNRDSSLNKIESMSRVAVPKPSSLQFVDDGGKPHLQAMYKHRRPDAGLRHETQFSDGTLRLICLAWSMLQGSGPLLLEEPELSLNYGIAELIPSLLHPMRKKKDRQAFISTHSEGLLSDAGISLDEILLPLPGKEGPSPPVQRSRMRTSCSKLDSRLWKSPFRASARKASRASSSSSSCESLGGTARRKTPDHVDKPS